MQVTQIPCLRDNYAYLLQSKGESGAVVVDPSAAGPVLEALSKAGLELLAIWNTHHHHDHVGGNKELLERFPRARVVAHASDKGRVPAQSAFVEDGEIVTAGPFQARVIFNPGHTKGAISYHLEEQGWLFTGDTLFAAGCGRLFEGTPAQMLRSLKTLTALPEETRIYCGHEYTLANLRFAAAAEPDNLAIPKRAEKVQALRDKGETSMGFSVAEEKATNVFLRGSEPSVVAVVSKEEPPTTSEEVEVFAALRRWKDRF